MVSTCLFNLQAEYNMWHTRLDKSLAGIKIAGRNINNLNDADDTALMAGSEEELKNLLIKVKEESEKSSLKLKLKNPKILTFSPIRSWQIEGKMWKQWQNLFSLGWWWQPWN